MYKNKMLNFMLLLLLVGTISCKSNRGTVNTDSNNNLENKNTLSPELAKELTILMKSREDGKVKDETSNSEFVKKELRMLMKRTPRLIK